MSLLELRQGISDTLLAQVPIIKAAYMHGGKYFTLQDLKRVGVQTPCIFTACLGIQSIDDEGGQIVARARWGVFIVCQGSSTELRDAQALVLVELIANQINANDWGVDGVKGPERIEVENLYSPALDATGAAIWGISWTQRVDLISIAEGMTPFTSLDATYRMTESTRASDAEDLVQLEGAA